MSAKTPEVYITDRTSWGEGLLKRSPKLQEVITTYAESPTPEGIRIEGAHLIGEQRHSRVFVVDSIALKTSSASTGIAPEGSDGPTPKEDLSLQFTTLCSLRDHLAGNAEGVYVPVQFFVAKTSHTDLLGQQFMNGWVTIDYLTYLEYGPKEELTKHGRREVDARTTAIAHRITRALRGFSLLGNINDLVGKKDGRVVLHGGNILVPIGATLGDTPPVCIIDQPAPHGSPWKEIKY